MKKIIITLSSLLISTSLFASNNFCKNLTGTWSGTYSDPTGLFSAGNFPISLQLQFKKGKVYGYTLPANDSTAGSFGANNGAYFFTATCTKNTLSKAYFVKNQNPVCGDPSTSSTALTQKSVINNLILPYENAMTGANLKANLSKQVPATPRDSKLLAQVETIANGTITTCH